MKSGMKRSSKKLYRDVPTLEHSTATLPVFINNVSGRAVMEQKWNRNMAQYGQIQDFESISYLLYVLHPT